MTKVLDSAGLQTLITAIKNGTLEVGKVKTDGTVPVSALSGVINSANLPKSALERLVVVENDTARFALTSEQIQVGDTCKVEATGKMYFVVDDTKLSTEDGWEVYSAGTAAEANHATTADSATYATSAGSATKDSAGNTISTTYAKTSAVATKAQGTKADTAVQSVKISGSDTELKSGTNVVLPAYPTSLPASDVTDSYSSTGTAPVSGKAVASAISGKANKATTLAGYGITDAATSVQGGKADTAVQSVKITSSGEELKSGTNVILPAYPTTLPASDVSAWAKAATKPTYTASEVGAATSAQGGKADTAVQSVKIGSTEYKSGTNVVLPAYPTTLPASDVSSWAKATSKPTYDATEVKVKSGYAKASAAAAVAAGDTIQVAIGKIEKSMDAKLSSTTAASTYIAKTDIVALTDAEITAMF